MIRLFTGDNTFEIRQAVDEIVATFDGEPERLDGYALDMNDLPDLFMGVTLFSMKRLIIIKDVTSNTAVWQKLPDYLSQLSDETDLILIDTKPDKRTVTYKAVKQVADIREFVQYTDRDRPRLETWLVASAKAEGLALERQAATLLVDRVGYDQWQLASAIEKLVALGRADRATIEHYIDQNPFENVFGLYELALNGRTGDIQAALRTLELTEDPFRLFALLSSQSLQLAAIAAAGPDDTPAKDLGIHPFVVTKLSRHAHRLGLQTCLAQLALFADADTDLKRSRGEPWLVIEKLLYSVVAAR